MDLGLKNKNVIVTGSKRGLGSNIIESFASEGSNVVLNYTTGDEAAEKAISEIRQLYKVKGIAIKGDISDESFVKELFRQTVDQLGDVDILVNNAGICPVSLVKDMDYSEWSRVISVNLSSMFLTSRELIRYLIANNKKGNIVNIASQAAYNGAKRGKTHYAASKGGVVTFTHSLAQEVASYGIRVNAVAPGMIYTEMTAATINAELERYNSKIPLGRVAEAKEVSKAVLFLASDVSSYITGSTMDVSGGIISR